MSLCGHQKRVDGRRDPLVCNQPVGHLGPHGISVEPTLPPYVIWTE